MNTLFIYLANLNFIQQVVLLCIRVRLFLDRFWGLLRFKALVPNSGNGSFYNSDIQVKYGKNIKVGNSVKIGGGCTLGAMSSIVIKDNVTISKNVTIETAGLDMNTTIPYDHKAKPILIEDGVWIASNVIILGGVTVGSNSIIGAGVILTKNVKANSIIVGQENRILDKETRK
ncbi:MAG: hypothetical protein RLZZ292_3409 [Bacteroidota bacterium]|jgi:acetyltransferase-like isoleucine patch superfamily enzyme